MEQLLDEKRRAELEALRRANEEPYFGRIEFEPDDQPTVSSLAIGKRGIQEENGDLLVIDWRAPIASLFYSFSGQTDRARYECPDGEVEGTVHLKRNVVIRQGELLRVVDSYVRGSENLSVADEFLLYRLSESKDHRLRDIVSTIQTEQDRIIRAPLGSVCIIQGVPGSGKTTVALHRLAFLLYHYQDRIRAEKMIIFAPNGLFLDYISEVLPELGVGGIQQTTFEAWALSILEKTEQIPFQDSTTGARKWFEEQKGMLGSFEEKAREKGSIRFLKELERFLDQVEKNFIPNKGFTAWENTSLPIETIRRWFTHEYKHEPLMKRKQRVIQRIKRWIEMEHKVIRWEDPRGMNKKKANRRLTQYLKSWPDLTPLHLYAHFLEKGADADVAPLFSKKKRNPMELGVHYEDLAPLLIIHERLYGMDRKAMFDHVVIDEAQDFSPLQFEVLKRVCPSFSLTVLGDLAQNIYSFRGVRTWRDVEGLFPEKKIQFYELGRSYRSTYEIVQFANEVLAPHRQGIKPAKPVFRSGEPVQMIEAEPGGQDHAVLQAVQHLRKKSMHTIAVLTRTSGEAEQLCRKLQEWGLPARLISGMENGYTGGLSVAPVYLTKGMEFDAVVLAGMNADNYPDDFFHAKLCYVGCTRALHYLILVAEPDRSPILLRISLERVETVKRS